MKDKEFRYSEIFKSIQGEGQYTGVPSLWLRVWGCNFNCDGFGQADISNKSTWKKPYENYDLINVKSIEELPVWEYGCDSSYTWSSKYRHLAHRETAREIVNKIENLCCDKYNPNGTFKHPSGLDQHMVFTGGEPLMSQHAIVSVLQEFIKRNNVPAYITVETNGTQPLKKELLDIITELKSTTQFKEWFWSVSPKLSNSGEEWYAAIKPEIVKSYLSASTSGQLKYVVDGSDQCWDEVNMATNMYRNQNISWPIWIMPVGATVEGQDKVAGKIADDAISRGYNVSARVHCYLWGNEIGR